MNPDPITAATATVPTAAASTSTPQSGSFRTFPIVKTPTPPSRFCKSGNPFEPNRPLHLSFINSPSLFHQPATPQKCSTQSVLEWTVDEISVLNPANIEAHETQFVSSIDAETDAKEQAAIATFFKNGIIAPSPDDCPLRSQKIVLRKMTMTDNLDSCDISSPTELTPPSILPNKDALRPNFAYTQHQQTTPTKDCDRSSNVTMEHTPTIDHDACNELLLRKLFPTTVAINVSADSAEFECDLQSDSPAPQTPEMQLTDMRSVRSMMSPQDIDEHKSPLDILLDGSGRQSFGCLSPISIDDPMNASSPQPKNSTIITGER